MTFSKYFKILILSFVFITIPSFSFGESLYGDFVKPPTDYQRGFYMGTDSGLLFFLGTNGKIQNPGYSVSFMLGYDFSKYLSIESRFMSGINNAEKTEPLNGGIYTFQCNEIIRGFYPINRFFPFVDLGMGLFFTKPDYEAGSNYKYNIEVGWGAEYYTYQRHFSLALRGSYLYVPGNLPEALVFSLMLKYTF